MDEGIPSVDHAAAMAALDQDQGTGSNDDSEQDGQEEKGDNVSVGYRGFHGSDMVEGDEADQGDSA